MKSDLIRQSAVNEVDLKGITIKDLQQIVEFRKEPKFRASQILNWIYNRRISNRVDNLGDMTNIPKTCIEKLQPVTSTSSLALRKIEGNKYYFITEDGHDFAVFLREGKISLVSQVGCAYECKFCASNKKKFIRHLKTGEIIDQILKAQKSIPDINEVDFSGMGEPLADYKTIRDTIEIINASWGLNIPFENIRLFTCGLVPQIKKIADSQQTINLTVGLHSVDDNIRSILMSVNKTYPVDSLLDAIRYYGYNTGVTVELEYMLLEGLNDAYDDIKLLTKKLLRLPVKVILTTYETIARRGFIPVGMERQEKFLNALIAGNIKAEIR